MENILNNLTEKLVGLDNYVGDDIILDEQEFDINEKTVFVSGKITYTFKKSVGDYLTPSYIDRNFYSADLNVKIYENSDDEEGSILSNEQLDMLYKNIKRYNR
jgi:hypothetical protein